MTPINTCDICDNNCKTCNSSSTFCLSCYEGYDLILNNTCVICSEPCKTCSDENICSSCIDNYFLLSGICYECNISCLTIKDDNCRCDSCEEGYYLYNFQCLICDSNCKSCENDSINCVTCENGNYLTSNRTCEICDSNCKTCSGTSTYCLSCDVGYYLNSNNTCILCSEPCKTCLSSSICLTCIDNYFLLSNKCYECNFNCKETENDNCKCKSCEDGYYLLNYQCLICDQNCKTCQNDSIYCLTCEDGKYLTSNNTCDKCLEPCNTCSDSPTFCLNCIERYYFLPNNTCEPCSEPCETCLSSSICLTCIDNYFLLSNKCYECNFNCKETENDNCKCKRCNDGYYLLNYQCLICNSNCKTCQYDSINCLTCEDGNYLTFDKTCDNCTETCKTCSGSATYCLSCIEDYVLLSNNTCIYYVNAIELNLVNNENITQKLISVSNKNPIIYECKNDETSNCGFLNINNNTEIFDILKNNLKNIYELDNGKGQIIQGENNMVFQVTNGNNELKLLKSGALNNKNLSIIDLTQCEIKLKKEYNLNDDVSLVYLKQENTKAKGSAKNIQYEIYEPYNFTKLNISICEGEPVSLFVKLDLSEEMQSIYDNMKELGYNMLDINDPFYQDICSPYNSDNNTDILLSDRIDYIYNNKDSQCQSNCGFSSYLPNSLYMNCSCSVTEEKPEEVATFSGKKIYESFWDILKNSNIKILKCYNLVFRKIIFKNNYGNIIILIIFIIYLTCFIFFIIKSITPLKNKIEIIINKPEEKIENKNDNINNKNKIENKINQNQIIKNTIFSNPVKKKSFINNKKEENKIHIFQKKDSKINYFYESLKPYFLKSNMDKNKSKINSKSELIISDKNVIIHKIENLKTEKEEIKKNYDAYELNNLDYEEAILYDKRNFIRTYIDLLNREHKIIFTFIICNDYNLLYIKLARFLFLFANDMAMNVFFFSDESMHKIYLNYGKYNFIQQIPQIVYTTIISQLIEVFLCYLSLTDKHIYQIKTFLPKQKDTSVLELLKCINMKLISFFIFTFILFWFYWYTVTAFCSVYKNTQITFIKDSLLSFLLGILYPFVLYLFPSFLRIIALRYPKINLKCLYKLSDIIPFF